MESATTVSLEVAFNDSMSVVASLIQRHEVHLTLREGGFRSWAVNVLDHVVHVVVVNIFWCKSTSWKKRRSYQMYFCPMNSGYLFPKFFQKLLKLALTNNRYRSNNVYLINLTWIFTCKYTIIFICLLCSNQGQV